MSNSNISIGNGISDRDHRVPSSNQTGEIMQPAHANTIFIDTKEVPSELFLEVLLELSGRLPSA